MSTGGYAGIPMSYTPVEYIESSGTQYIDTGIAANQNTGFEIDFIMYNPISTSGYGYILGSYDGTKRLSMNTYPFTSGAGGELFVTTGFNAYITQNVRKQITYKNSVFLDNDGHTYTVSVSAFSVQKNMMLFTTSNASGVVTANMASARVYSFKLYDGNNLVRDFIPVIDENNVACLYEEVEGKFYYNQGTGTFTAGSATGSAVTVGDRARKITKVYVGVNYAYTPIEYIEATGTQAIDTLYTPSNLTKVIIDFQSTDVSSATTTKFLNAGSGSSSTPAFSMQNAYAGGLGTNYDRARYAFGPNYNYYEDFTGLANTNRHTVEINCTTGEIIVDGTTTRTITPSTFTASETMKVFPSGGKGKLYSLKIYEGGTLVKDFVPTLEKGVTPCLWEKEEELAYFNAGAGTFATGSATGDPDIMSGAKARKVNVGYVGVNTTLYTPVEYIESSGTQYIDVGVQGTGTTDFEIKFHTNTTIGTSQTVIGGRTSVSSNRFQVFFNDDYSFWYAYNTSANSLGSVTNNTDYVIKKSGTQIYNNGSLSTTITTATFSTPYNLYLFGNNENGTFAFPFYSKIYYCKIWENGVLVRDFIPVLDGNNVACLLERVENKFYYNKGTGIFSYGTVGTPVIGEVARTCYVHKPKYTMLYSYGDLGESGDFFKTRFYNSASSKDHDFGTNFTYTKEATDLKIYGNQPSTSYDSSAGILTNNQFDMSKYSAIYAKSSYTNMGRGTNLYICTFTPGATYNLNSNATRSMCFQVAGSSAQMIVNKPNNAFTISKTDTRKIGYGVASEGWGGNATGYLYVLALFEPDDITQLAAYLGVNPTISDILAVSSQLLSDIGAVRMMLKCTGDFMITALNNSTFMTQLNSSAYKSIVLGNTAWNKFYTYVTT